eukprot:1160905-Pelagomonas_calceolata.AAC.2
MTDIALQSRKGPVHVSVVDQCCSALMRRGCKQQSAIQGAPLQGPDRSCAFLHFVGRIKAFFAIRKLYRDQLQAWQMKATAKMSTDAHKGLTLGAQPWYEHKKSCALTKAN